MTRAPTMRVLSRRMARAWLTMFLRGLIAEQPPTDLVVLLTDDERQQLRRRVRGDA